ncbi:MAG: superoxide dismutase [Candidatus Pacebacteria bacterium]|nr:superoxide dismutase [Candidatus Paceibacterota bacterium]
MQKFEAKKFNIPTLKGISEKTIEEHVKLYEGYVKHANLILEEISSRDAEKDAYAISEMQRRFSFEFDGMRNHEVYFDSLEGGAKDISDSELKNKITEDFGSFENWIARFKTIAKTRGIGWAILYFDTKTNQLLNSWVDEQHLGHLNGCIPILALDMWEHSFVADYYPSGKATYIEDFFANLNWEIIENNFDNCKR